MLGSKYKNAILDYINEHHKMGCQKLSEHFSVGKTGILKYFERH